MVSTNSIRSRNEATTVGGEGGLRGSEVLLFGGLLDEMGEGRELRWWRRHKKYMDEGVIILLSI